MFSRHMSWRVLGTIVVTPSDRMERHVTKDGSSRSLRANVRMEFILYRYVDEMQELGVDGGADARSHRERSVGGCLQQDSEQGSEWHDHGADEPIQPEICDRVI